MTLQVSRSPRPFLRLYRAMTASVVGAFCCRHRIINALLHILCAPFILEMTRLGIKMESVIARDGHLSGACAWLVDIASRSIDIAGAQHIPRAGALLLVGNHAGLGDAHAILMASPRRDTLLLAHDFDMLPGLAQFRQYVIVVDAARPQAAIRRAIRHLRGGGSILLFPRGEIETDPALDLDAALDSLAGWTRSIDLFARQAPGLTIVPAAVAGSAVAARPAESAGAALPRRGEAALSGGDLPDDVPLIPRCGYSAALWMSPARRAGESR